MKGTPGGLAMGNVRVIAPQSRARLLTSPLRDRTTKSQRRLCEEHDDSPLVTPQVAGNLSDLPVRNGSTRPHDVAFSIASSGTWVDVTNAEFLADVHALAKGLMAAGIGLGER